MKKLTPFQKSKKWLDEFESFLSEYRMFSFISEMLTNHLGVAEEARRTGLPLPSLEIDDFIDQKFNDYVGGWV